MNTVATHNSDTPYSDSYAYIDTLFLLTKMSLFWEAVFILVIIGPHFLELILL